MFRAALAPLAVLSALALESSSFAGDRDYFISVPAKDMVVRIDAVTLQATPFLVNLNTPFYGFHVQNGDFYLPDHGFGTILRIDPNGTPTLLTSGGYLTSPVALLTDPAGGFIATDLYQHTVVHVDNAGNQTLIHDAVTSGGLLYGPGGLDFDPDGNLFVANNTGDTIVKIDPANNITLWSASPLIKTPGGIAIDGCGNMFVAMYDGGSIVRFRLDTGEAEIFAQDWSKMIRPNDLKMSRGGRLLTTTRLSNLVEIDALGHVNELFRDSAYSDVLGVSVPIDWQPCTGRGIAYGTGLAGSGGFVPQLRAIFSPCPGESFALEWRDFLGGSSAILIAGLAPANVSALSGTVLVDLTPPSVVALVALPGAGAGAGDLRVKFELPALAGLTGLHIYTQCLGADPAAPSGVSFSNGLELIVGS